MKAQDERALRQGPSVPPLERDRGTAGRGPAGVRVVLTHHARGPVHHGGGVHPARSIGRGVWGGAPPAAHYGRVIPPGPVFLYPDVVQLLNGSVGLRRLVRVRKGGFMDRIKKSAWALLGYALLMVAGGPSAKGQTIVAGAVTPELGATPPACQVTIDVIKCDAAFDRNKKFVVIFQVDITNDPACLPGTVVVNSFLTITGGPASGLVLKGDMLHPSRPAIRTENTQSDPTEVYDYALHKKGTVLSGVNEQKYDFDNVTVIESRITAVAKDGTTARETCRSVPLE